MRSQPLRPSLKTNTCLSHFTLLRNMLIGSLQIKMSRDYIHQTGSFILIHIIFIRNQPFA